MAISLRNLIVQSSTLLVLSCAWFAQSSTGKVVQVKSGQSIQAAINASQPGGIVYVQAGIYAEQLTITTNGLQLVGNGAVLVPPNSFVNNTCTGLAGPGTEAGICVTGKNIKLAPYKEEHRKVLSVGTPVSNVLVTGFEVQNFTGLDIAVVGGNGVEVFSNVLHDGQQYGCLTVGSNNTHIAGNEVVATGGPDAPLFIGICMDDKSNVSVTENRIDNYLTGLCVQTNGAFVYGNTVTGACWAAFVDPGVKGAMVIGNNLTSGNPACAGYPMVNLVNGIIMDGAIGTIVVGNLITNMSSGGNPNGTGIGILVYDDPMVPANASGNEIVDNTLRMNDVDIFFLSNQTTNLATGNNCTNMTGLCGM
jgi:hypothetical protein